MDAQDNTPDPYTIVNAGVDWLTATAYKTSGHHSFYDTANRLLEAAASIGNEVTPWRGSGYHGRRAAGVAIGVRYDTWIAKLSGDDARESWRALYPLASNVSRLDVQVTFKLNRPDPTFFERQRALALASHGRRGRRSDIKYIGSSMTGDSLYLGKRTSNIYARCYDKGREENSDVAGSIIRQEIEYKRDHAKDVAMQLYQSSSDAIESNGLVSSFFKTHSIQTTSGEERIAVGARGRATTVEQRLGWLGQAVAPSIKFLLTQGKLVETLAALGLAEYVQPRLATPDED